MCLAKNFNEPVASYTTLFDDQMCEIWREIETESQLHCVDCYHKVKETSITVFKNSACHGLSTRRFSDKGEVGCQT